MGFCRTKFQYAKKRYRCDHCGRFINKGEHYVYAAGVAEFDNTFRQERRCITCAQEISDRYDLVLDSQSVYDFAERETK